MLSKCANPACEAKFRYLYEGKVYVADWVGGDGVGQGGTTCWRRTEMFWLCDKCSHKFALVKKGSSVVPVKLGVESDPSYSLLREMRIGG